MKIKLKIKVRREWGFNPMVRVRGSKKKYVRQKNWAGEIE